MAKSNCWEFKKCGREPGGAKSAELGVCPVATKTNANGLHSGKNGGRTCWVIAGTLCGGKVQGTFAHKVANCLECEFYRMVKEEEGGDFIMSSKLLDMLR